jgi:hypothetical protein
VDNEISKGHGQAVDIVAGNEVTVDLQILNGYKENVSDSVNITLRATVSPGSKETKDLTRQKTKK